MAGVHHRPGLSPPGVVPGRCTFTVHHVHGLRPRYRVAIWIRGSCGEQVSEECSVSKTIEDLASTKKEGAR